MLLSRWAFNSLGFWWWLCGFLGVVLLTTGQMGWVSQVQRPEFSWETLTQQEHVASLSRVSLSRIGSKSRIDGNFPMLAVFIHLGSSYSCKNCTCFSCECSLDVYFWMLSLWINSKKAGLIVLIFWDCRSIPHNLVNTTPASDCSNTGPCSHSQC